MTPVRISDRASLDSIDLVENLGVRVTAQEPIAVYAINDLPFAAESPDALLVVTTRGLVRVMTSGTVEQLLPTNYGLLYPNSMTLSASGVLHVGMRHFVTRLTPTGNNYREAWFVPVGCTKFKILDYDCVCASGGK